MIFLLFIITYALLGYCFAEADDKDLQQPQTDIHAEVLECDTLKGKCIATGYPHPYVIRNDKAGTKIIEAKKLTVIYDVYDKNDKKTDVDKKNQIKIIEAISNAKITIKKPSPQKDVIITSNRGRMEYQKQMLYLTGNVVINDGLNTIRGNNGEVNMKTGVYKIKGKTRSKIMPKNTKKIKSK
jgi:lipopolysaccharide export system protein LptA